MFIAEFKKLWQPILIVVAIGLSFVFYRESLFFIYEMWPNGGMVPKYETIAAMQARYGNELTDDNWQELEQAYQKNVTEVNAFLANSSLAQRYELNDYQSFRAFEETVGAFGPVAELTAADQKVSEDYALLSESLVTEQGESLGQTLAIFESMAEGFEAFQTQQVTLYDNQRVPLSSAEKAKLTRQLFNKKETWRTLLPVGLARLTAGHFNEVLLLVMILLSLLIPSIFVRDRLLGITKTQWSSQRGRKIVGTQYAVNLVGSVLVIGGVVGYYVYHYFQTDFTRYFASGLTSFLADRYETAFSFFTWTFGQWVSLIILLTCLLSVAFAGVLYFFSQTSNNYLSLLLKIIPTIVLGYLISSQILGSAFYVDNALYQLTGIPLSELYLSLLLCVAGIFLGCVPVIRSRKQALLI